MAASGFSVVRLMEFAWALLEPEPDRYDFSLFDEAIELFLSRGISVILGTPTAAMPAWLGTDPSVLQVHPTAGQRNFGSRRQACLNSPRYLDRADRITSALAKHFAQKFGRRDKNHPDKTRGVLIGWQIDNELGHEGSDLCICENCRAAWAGWLEQRYGSLDALNEEWGAVFWSTSYADWRQVPMPGAKVFSGQNPGLMLDWYRFMSDSVSSFVARQAAILRAANPGWELTSNTFMPPNGHVLNLRDLFRDLDIVGINNYPVWGDQPQPVPMQYHSTSIRLMRDALPGRQFTVFEQICGFQGHAYLGYLPLPQQIVFWMNHIAALGATRILFFRWRTAPFGQEQLCHGLVDPWSADSPHFRAIRRELLRRRDFHARLAGSRPAVRAAVIYKKDDARLLKEQPLSAGFSLPAGFIDVGYDAELANAAAPLLLYGLDYLVLEEAEVLENPELLGGLDFLVLPIPQLSNPAFVSTVLAWTARGGHLVLGWRAGTRTAGNRAPAFPPPGPWAEAAGLTIPTYQSLGKGVRSISLQTGFLGAVLNIVGALLPGLRPQATVWEDHQLPAADGKTRVLALFGSGPGKVGGAGGGAAGSAAGGGAAGSAAGSAMGAGFAAASHRIFGAGSVLTLGTRLSPAALLGVFAFFFREARKALRRRSAASVLAGSSGGAARRLAATGPAGTVPGLAAETAADLRAGTAADLPIGGAPPNLPLPRFLGEGLELVTRVDEEGNLFGVLLNHTGKTKRTRYGTVRPWDFRIVEFGPAGKLQGGSADRK